MDKIHIEIERVANGYVMDWEVTHPEHARERWVFMIGIAVRNLVSGRVERWFEGHHTPQYADDRNPEPDKPLPCPFCSGEKVCGSRL